MVGLPPRARKIAMVFQSYALYPHKTARKNIEFPLKAAGMAPEERAKKIEWAAELLGITRLLDRRPRHLSGGERQRVALARALVREPDVFLLDEPLSNLDAKLRATARDDLKQFQDRVDTTTIYVTHDQVEAMGLGDRIAVMAEGRIRQLGTPFEVYDDPADTFVATFLGSPPMNMVERDDTIVGFRPESLLPKGVVDADAEAVSVAFAVSRVEYLGAERQVVGTVEGLGPPTRAIALLPANVSIPVPAGETSEFVVRGADLRFFDKGDRPAGAPAHAVTDGAGTPSPARPAATGAAAPVPARPGGLPRAAPARCPPSSTSWPWWRSRSSSPSATA